VWIALSPDGIGKTGFGLHGYTGEDQTLRKQASNGCLRLGNEAIKELAYLISHPNRSPTAAEIVD
jgi:lipoprotein-anchoring transpeptidase ErfK/SrfK